MAFSPVFPRVFSPTFDRRAGFGWLLRDEFTTDLAAGSVNGTAAEPGPGTRRTVETLGTVNIANGKIVLNGYSGSYGDPLLYYETGITRVPGRLLLVKQSNFATTAGYFGLRTTTTGLWNTSTNEAFWIVAGNRVRAHGIESNGLTVAESRVASALRSAGVFYFRLTSGVWILELVRNIGSTATLYFSASNYFVHTPSEHSEIRVPDALWLPTPLASDGFGSTFGTTDGLGHAEGIAGGIGSGGGGKVWSNVGGTWSVSGGKAINTPSVSTELCLNGNMETGDPPSSWSYVNATADGVASERTGGSGVQSLQLTTTATGEPYASQNQSLVSGKWFRLSAWAKQTTGSQGVKLRVRDNYVGGHFIETPKVTSSSWTSVVGTGRSYWTSHAIWAMFSNSASIGDVGSFDDVSFYELALSDLLSLTSASCADVFASVSINRGSTAVQSGLALNWNSATTPTNGVIVYLAGNYIIIAKCVSGAWSEVSGTNYTYSAGAALVVAKSGTEYRVYYNNAFIVESTISDAGIVNNTLHGLFSTDANNTLDNFVIYPTGTGGEYSYLDQFTS